MIWRVVLLLALIMACGTRSARGEVAEKLPAPYAAGIKALRACVDESFARVSGDVSHCDPSEHVEACSGDSNRELRQCSAGRQLAWQVIVDDTYGRLTDHFRSHDSVLDEGADKEILSRLEQSQTDWTAYLESQCRWSAVYFFGGSGEATELLACRQKMTRERALQLLDDLWYFTMR